MVNIFYIFRRITSGIRMRPFGSLLTMIACWFAICQLCFVLYAITLAHRATQVPGTNSTVMAYLEGTQQQPVVLATQEKITLIEGVSQVRYIPRGEGLHRMKQWLGAENPLIQGLDPDILPDAFEIRIGPQYVSEIETLVERLQEIPSIEDVRYHRGLIGCIAGAYHTIVLAGLFIAAVVLVCLGLVLFLSVRVGIMTRHREIEVLNILGAKRSFLSAPYIIEAGLYGATGALLALMTVRASMGYVMSHVPALSDTISPLSADTALAVIVFACGCSMLGAVLAIRRSIDA